MTEDETRNRIRELEKQVEEVEELVFENRKEAQYRIGSLMRRVTELEALAFESSLGVEAELSEMERILCGFDDEPRVGTSRHRAFILADLWRQIGVDKLAVGDLANLERHRLKPLISREERNSSGSSLEGTLSNKQIVRAMDAFVEMFDGKAERRKNTHTGVNELLIANPDKIIWSKGDVQDKIKEES